MAVAVKAAEGGGGGGRSAGGGDGEGGRVVVEEVAVGDGGVMLYIIETKIHNYKAIFVVLK